MCNGLVLLPILVRRSIHNHFVGELAFCLHLGGLGWFLEFLRFSWVRVSGESILSLLRTRFLIIFEGYYSNTCFINSIRESRYSYHYVAA